MSDHTSRRLVYAVTIVVSTVWAVIDQATKMATVRSFSDGTTLDLGPVILRYIENPGGAFSLPIHLPWLFVGVTVLVGILVARALPETDSLGLATAYGLVLGGAVGNAADRIFRDGAVVDMIDLNFPPLQSFPVFNVADIGITVGAVMVAVLMFVADRRERAAQQAVLDDAERPATLSTGPAPVDESLVEEPLVDGPSAPPTHHG